ncbi:MULTISPECIES: DUF3509 domain-containing protein [unclassified Pseudomonas]|uniref:DUF3509 domain-containing protein n=1 Tax=unclassified Pseudomonas TaxID=196821 RepID=UPI000BCC3682|nr:MULTISPECIES: DUF3509 domain-containing protein [unclassified Pseudomonas]PVZ16041.1 uncharacterized protein DUF3509 [Pseudomonas sp. URIL14HWK12:I12]PVZ26103.1 uncharacterized protein DUF3509 [Pseudomonas sp. URIL14HWK12:I10]PVZ36373.1 uncharacterized protein DUF3509 [Pseudomonas sp. URIL14HWK12:I11]SNZ18435.1 Protein of unknown function [Pseudomonas sp. URIL14HWK12:I9]
METISQLLSEALAPYQVVLSPAGREAHVMLVVSDPLGSTVLAREFHRIQLEDTRSLTDVVDGLHRDLMVAEGRLEPSMIAALRHAAAHRGYAATLR